jgi:hypothetical protein
MGIAANSNNVGWNETAYPALPNLPHTRHIPTVPLRMNFDHETYHQSLQGWVGSFQQLHVVIE